MNEYKNRKCFQKKRIITVILVIFITYAILSMSITIISFNIVFGRNELQADDISLKYSNIPVNEYPREFIQFTSGKNCLKGYVYGGNNSKGLIVIAHGIASGADTHLAEIMAFVNSGWQVFAFDGTGTRESGGDQIRGLPQTKIDLKAALHYIENNKDFEGMPICLYGHSMGGYAVTSLLSEHSDKIESVVCVSGFNEPLHTMLEQYKSVVGFFAYTQYPFILLYEQILFGADANSSAVEGINAVDLPVLIIYGTEDEVVPPDSVGISAFKTEIKNPNTLYLERSDNYCNSHDTLWLSKDAGEYFAKKRAELLELHNIYGKNIAEDAFKEFSSSINYFKIAELDEYYIKTVIRFFEKSIVD